MKGERRLQLVWSPEDTEQLRRAMAMHPASCHRAQVDDRPLAPVVDLRTRERVR